MEDVGVNPGRQPDTQANPAAGWSVNSRPPSALDQLAISPTASEVTGRVPRSFTPWVQPTPPAFPEIGTMLGAGRLGCVTQVNAAFRSAAGVAGVFWPRLNPPTAVSAGPGALAWKIGGMAAEQG
jgi:hypothetical protein